MKQKKFYSVQADGSSDTQIIIKEAVFVVTFNPVNSGSEKEETEKQHFLVCLTSTMQTPK